MPLENITSELELLPYELPSTSPKVRDHWENLGVGGRITLSWTFRRQGSMVRTGFSWLRIGSSGGLL
jgi:hypothetical protein